MATKSKIERKKELQKDEEKEALIQQALLFSRKRFKKFDEIIEQLYKGEDMSFSFADRRIWKINECFSTFFSNAKVVERKKLKEVLLYLNEKTELLKEEENIHAVYNMVLLRAYWLKDLFSWKPSAKQADIQMKELATHLFCKYAVPDFLCQCFYESGSKQFMFWFIHIGTGGKVKDMGNIPIPFTQRMSHYFLKAPAKLKIGEALRWAQVKGLNGDDKLAERIAYSWLGSKPYGHEVFWEGFIQLLTNGGMFNINKLTELIDYVRETKRANENYSLKGRTLQSLFRQSDEWHHRFSNVDNKSIWKACGINGYRIEKKTEVLVMEELTEARQLAVEGRSMKHCVSSYSFYCAKGRSAIFSLRRYSGGFLLDILATIEVSLVTQRVVQAKARHNKPISDEAKKHMELWATKEGLIINPYL